MGGAMVTNSGDSPVTAKLFTKANARPLFYCAIVVIGAVTYGYDGTYFTGILSQKKFNEDYGNTYTSTGEKQLSSDIQSVLTSIVQAGEVIGSLMAGPVGDWGGRKLGLTVACALITVGVILQLVLAGSVPLLGLGRAILGMGVGVISNAVPLYLSEVPPTAIRGSVVSSWQLLLAIGQVIGACVNQGSKDLTNTAAYRIPIGINLVFIVAILVGLLFIPESPRWYISKMRDSDALRALERICKGYEPGQRELVVQHEMDTFQAARRDEMESSGEGGWGTLFQGTQRRRFICGLGILICQQIGGVQFIFSYTTKLKAVGIANEFTITIVVDIIEVVGVICSFFLVNRLGRRPLLLWTSAVMAGCLLVCGGVGIVPEGERTAAQSNVIAAMIMLYVFFFNLAWGPLAWVVATELTVGKNRNRIMSLGTACFWVCAWAVTFTLPYLFDPGEANLNAMVGFIYAGGTVIAMLFVYFYIPETIGRTLEEINEMLEARVPTRQWTSYVCQISGKSGSGPGQPSDDGKMVVQRRDLSDSEKDNVGADGVGTGKGKKEDDVEDRPNEITIEHKE